MFFDLPIDQLRQYKPPREEEPDFGDFWKRTLDGIRKIPLAPVFTPYECGLKLVDSFSVEFSGSDGLRVKGWLLLPAGRKEKVPCILGFLGYGGGRSLPTDWLLWPSAGYAFLLMDTRGQGSVWSPGDTPDLEPEGSSPHAPGFMTRGILNPVTYYYRRVFGDAVRAVECARTHPDIDASRIGITGGSQGGGITLAVAGLVTDLACVMPDVPFLCHFRVATEITDSMPYAEIVQYCRVHRDHVDKVFRTLSYFDGVNFAARASAPALFSAGLMDEICPPRTVFAAFNHYRGPKEIRVWAYNTHEGGGVFQDVEKVKFAARCLA